MRLVVLEHDDAVGAGRRQVRDRVGQDQLHAPDAEDGEALRGAADGLVGVEGGAVAGVVDGLREEEPVGADGASGFRAGWFGGFGLGLGLDAGWCCGSSCLQLLRLVVEDFDADAGSVGV